MDFGFNDEYKMIQKMYRDFAEKEIKPLAEEIDENERFPKESIQKMADNEMLVQRAARVIREFGCEPATPDEARAMLSMKR